MTKVRITADQMLQIVQQVFNDNDIDIVENNGTSISLKEKLNIEYYSFKYRPESSEQMIADLKAQGQEVNELKATQRSFACFTVNAVDRVFNKDVDSVACDCVLDYWIQQGKLKLLEQQIDRATRLLSGQRIPVTFTQDGETVTRTAVIILSPIQGVSLDFNTPIGKAANLSVGVTIYLNPPSASWVDYSVKFSWINDGDSTVVTSEPIPVTSIAISANMNNQSVPTINNTVVTGGVNVSRAMTFTMIFDGIENTFISYLADRTLSGQITTDNNKLFNMILSRQGQEYTHEVVINSHSITVRADTTNELHNLTVTTRGLTDISVAL